MKKRYMKKLNTKFLHAFPVSTKLQLVPPGREKVQGKDIKFQRGNYTKTEENEDYTGRAW